MKIDNISYSFNPKGMDAVRQVSTSLHSPGLVSLIGPSGSGKTTLLRLIAGTLSPSSGKITCPQSRHLLEVLQVADKKTLLEHIGEGLPSSGEKAAPSDPTERANRLRELLELFELEGHCNKNLEELSQGELKRAHLAKSLFHPPPILLLDEPFSGLEPQLTFHIQRLLKQIAHREQLLIIMATHHIHEAMSLSDQVLVMKDGELIQQGDPREIYHWPRNSFVAGLFGPTNLITGQVVKIENFVQVETPFGLLTCQNNHGQQLHQAVLCHIRPEGILQISSVLKKLSCRVQEIHFWGGQTICELNYQDKTLYCSNVDNPSPGMWANFEFAYGKATILDDLATPLSSRETLH